jgi:hypothetical protein
MKKPAKQKNRKAEFLTPLLYDDFSTLAKPIDIETRAPFRFYSAILQCVVEVPNKTRSDGRSSPRLLWWAIPPTGPGLWAGVPHDSFYKHGGYFRVEADENGKEYLIFIPMTQQQADAVYRELLICKGFSRAQSWWSWYGLRKAGFVAWNNHRRND